MEFTECAKGRLTLTLKSSLLCAVMLMSAPTLAESLETARAAETTRPALVANPDAIIRTSAMSVTTATLVANPDAMSATTAALVANPDATIRTSAISASEQRKHSRLAGHIQRRYQVPPQKAERIVAEAFRNGSAHQVEPELILAIIAVESTFKEQAVSREGARGLMQVLPRSHPQKMRDIGGSHALFDPAKNIHTGSKILVKYLGAHSGNLRQALLKYNGSLGSRSSFPERVLRVYRDLRQVTTEG
jgi:soluble lytic murein transglycosylase-like protein